jgi:hypothetical protein
MYRLRTLHVALTLQIDLFREYSLVAAYHRLTNKCVESIIDGSKYEKSIHGITHISIERPQLMCDYPLNLSILMRGGKETKWDSPSSGERKGKSSARRVVGLTAY